MQAEWRKFEGFSDEERERVEAKLAELAEHHPLVRVELLHATQPEHGGHQVQVSTSIRGRQHRATRSDASLEDAVHASIAAFEALLLRSNGANIRSTASAPSVAAAPPREHAALPPVPAQPVPRVSAPAVVAPATVAVANPIDHSTRTDHTARTDRPTPRDGATAPDHAVGPTAPALPPVPIATRAAAESPLRTLASTLRKSGAARDRRRDAAAGPPRWSLPSVSFSLPSVDVDASLAAVRTRVADLELGESFDRLRQSLRSGARVGIRITAGAVVAGSFVVLASWSNWLDFGAGLGFGERVDPAAAYSAVARPVARPARAVPSYSAVATDSARSKMEYRDRRISSGAKDPRRLEATRAPAPGAIRTAAVRTMDLPSYSAIALPDFRAVALPDPAYYAIAGSTGSEARPGGAIADARY